MTDFARRIVSGKKSRFVHDGFDLDLVQLTNRIIIMGYPASGFAALYRNKRSDVLRFLEPFAPHYKIFNLCPLYENSYDASAFTHKGIDREGEPVARFPWPDHHPPPLSLMRIMSGEAKRWYAADEKNVVVIHCKAGKGRSGSFAISLLITLPGLPSAPPTSIPSSKDGEKDRNLCESKYALDPRAVTGKTEEEIAGMTMQEKLEYLLRFHTLRRMSPGAKQYGVSIASQRRFLGYFARLLSNDDPRQHLTLDEREHPPTPRKVVLEYVKINGPGLQGASKVLTGGKDKMAVKVYRYKYSIAANLRRRELALSAGEPLHPIDDANEWDDRDDMFVLVGGLIESCPANPATTSAAPSPSPSPAPQANVAPIAASSSHLPSDARAGASTASNASASTASLPSAVLDTPASSIAPSDTSSPVTLPPPNSSIADDSTATPKHPRTPRTRSLIPHTSFLPLPVSPLESTNPSRRAANEAKAAAKEEGGIVLDADREVMLKFLVGETGKKHGMLPDMAALAISWFIPSFECAPSSTVEGAGQRSKILLDRKELDFVKPFAGIDSVEIGWRWI
ncbi:hypothetical protein JCM11641_004902 [Rhodosporidiobolus odoratus]